MPVNSSIKALIIIFIFQLRFFLEIIRCFTSSSGLLIIAIKRKITLHLISQYLLSIALLTIVYIGDRLNFFIRSFVIVTIFLSLTCQNNIGPFRLPSFINNERSVIFQLSQMLNLMFSTAIMITVASNNNDIFNFSAQLFTLFAFKILLLISMFFVCFSFLPSFRTDQCKNIFIKIMAPLSGILLICIILMKM
ncbi:MAG: hypothetical protein LBQ43_00080 [Holosporales bacterium]|nr:hypothetical protein [Holosporales bacterium]